MKLPAWLTREPPAWWMRWGGFILWIVLAPFLIWGAGEFIGSWLIAAGLWAVALVAGLFGWNPYQDCPKENGQ